MNRRAFVAGLGAVLAAPRDEMGSWLQEYVPGVAIGAAHAIAGIGPKVGDWPVIPGDIGVYNWEYVTRAR